MKQVASAVVQRRRLLPSGTAKQIGASKKRASINPPSTPTLATLVETSDKPGSTEHFPSLTDAISRPNSSPTAATLAPAKPLGLLSLVATLFFVVSGGPYGLEEIVSGHGYLNTLILLLVVPLIWSVPSALMVGELASVLPHEGGYYTWVRRALGPFWGMQEAWLMVAFSLFDMAIYPTLLVTYLAASSRRCATPASAAAAGGLASPWLWSACCGTCAAAARSARAASGWARFFCSRLSSSRSTARWLFVTSAGIS